MEDICRRNTWRCCLFIGRGGKARIGAMIADMYPEILQTIVEPKSQKKKIISE